MALKLHETQTARRPISTSDPEVFLVAHPTEKWDEMRGWLVAINEAHEAGKMEEPETVEMIKSVTLSVFQEWLCDEYGEVPEPDEVSEKVILAMAPYKLRAYMELFSEAIMSMGKQSEPQKTPVATSKRGSTRRGARRGSRTSPKKS